MSRRIPDGYTAHGESDRVYAAILALRRKGYKVERKNKLFSLVDGKAMNTRAELVAFAATAPVVE